MTNSPHIPFIEFCAGVSAFHQASKRIVNAQFECIGTSEIDSFCNTFLDQQGLNVFGDVNYVACSDEEHPYTAICEADDIVPCEINNDISSLTMQDLLEGVVPNPKAAIAGFSCQTLSSANTQEHNGINGKKSSIIHCLLDKFEDLEPEVIILENSPNLLSGGLEYCVSRLTEMGYRVEWDVISATAFGYPYYRHRCFIVAYNSDSPIYHSTVSVLDVVASKHAVHKPGSKFPTLANHSKALMDDIVSLESKGNYRRHRVKALGNSILVDIAQAILQVIADLYCDCTSHSEVIKTRVEPFIIKDLPLNSKSGFRKFPSRGLAEPGNNGSLMQGSVDKNLNPSKTAYKNLGLMQSLIANDHKNNFTTSSRLNRPGGLGGLVGYLMQQLDLREGAINPVYCEQVMGFDKGTTAITTKLMTDKIYKSQ